MAVFLDEIVLYCSEFFWFWLFNTRLLILFVLLIILAVVLTLVKLFETRKQKNTEKLIYEYDNIVYLVSWYNYQTWTNDAMVMFEKIFSKKKPSYMAKRKLIFSSVEKLEKDFWKKIVPEWNWKTIKQLTKKIGLQSFLSKLLKLMAIIVLLAFVLWVVYLLILK